MKKTKKHQFSHPDPEKSNITPGLNTESSGDKPVSEDNVPAFVYRDLKRTGMIVGSFFIMVVLLYGIQLKTSWLSPVLKKFGL